VRNALAALPPGCDIVLVHDAARALAPTSLADAVARRVAAGAAAVIPALPVSDTIKRVDGEGRVVDTLDRAALRAVQTPQGFRRDLLVAVHERAAAAGFEATDDASLAEWAGEAVVTVPGSPLALKVTHPLDLRIAEVLLRAE
jgi:2-C-methyl-D-erythritol 4-phosphate cytidylyltransferase